MDAHITVLSNNQSLWNKFKHVEKNFNQIKVSTRIKNKNRIFKNLYLQITRHETHTDQQQIHMDVHLSFFANILVPKS